MTLQRTALGFVVAATLGCTGTIGGETGDGTTSPGSYGTPGGPGGPGGPGTTTIPPGAEDDPTICVPGIPQTSQIPRLTRSQYDATIRGLFDLDSAPSTMLAPDTSGSVDKRAWDGFQAAAESLAGQVMADPNARGKAIPCTSNDDACALSMVQSLGQKAFRRPLTVDEVNRFLTLYTNRAEITETGSFDEAAQLIIRTMLLSPSFLMRAEIAEVPSGEHLALNAYEVATRLSYMLWDSMPDQALFDAAAANALSTAEQIRAQADRMLQDPKARGKVSAFHRQYAHMGEGTRWTDIARDSSAYPNFNESLIPLFSQETEMFFDQIVFGGGTFKDLLTSPVAFVNAALAPLYGLDAAAYGEQFEQVTLDATMRPGVFTRVGFLAAYSLANRPSPILRGAFIQKDVLCREIGAPPPDAESTPLPTSGTTNRERVDAQTASNDCASCHHGIINPTGFALENFDAMGVYRTTEGTATINTAATVPIGSTPVEVSGPESLLQAIAGSRDANLCYARKWVQAAYERGLTNEDSCTAENLTDKLTAGGYTVLNLIADLTQADSFRLRAVPEVAP